MKGGQARDPLLVEVNEGGDFAVAAVLAADPTARVVRVYRTRPGTGGTSAP